MGHWPRQPLKSAREGIHDVAEAIIFFPAPYVYFMLLSNGSSYYDFLVSSHLRFLLGIFTLIGLHIGLKTARFQHFLAAFFLQADGHAFHAAGRGNFRPAGLPAQDVLSRYFGAATRRHDYDTLRAYR